MDALSKLIQQLSMRSEVFYTGQLCGTSSFGDDEKNQGHLHIVREGKLILRDHKGKEMKVDEPSIVYFPQTVPHVIEGLSDGAQLVCSTIEYSEGKWELLFSALPDKIVIPFRTLPALSPIMEGLFLEAESAELGQQVILDKLSDVMMIMLFRHIVDSNLVKQGVLAGLSHPRLSEVLNMIHQLPYKAFTMEDMAEKGAMSRTVFIDTFKKVVGMTPGNYVAHWRIGAAQSLILQGKPMHWVLDHVGYESYSGFSKVFRKITGVSPRQWMALKKEADEREL
ncbi:AraC family transcriptional regulator [Vibrio penaeicida]|uniref:AraC family transcriptional regulator n=1 Tax=Vibrio penaeicida TaxID=104609 RepID=UPI002732F114|nr:AraC family transcriptional regulator [Vibrio penaeicida]MDP2574508.1 AraC family transcriptional regulator [Vibrio penaeicida]